MTPTSDDAVIVWAITDGRAGHRSQIDGLVSQLKRRVPVDVHEIPGERLKFRRTCRDLFHSRFPAGISAPDPTLILAAGHVTHLPALAARRARGGNAVILMRPSIPCGMFDLCLIPEHDLHTGFGRLSRLNVVKTRGVLNAISKATNADASRGLILIGGPSRHHAWSDDAVLQQVTELITTAPSSVRWTLTTSRRTPFSLTHHVSELSRETVNVVPLHETGPGWLAHQLATHQTVFVSEDSVSMIYESLTSGADVGLLSVPRVRRSRVVRGIDGLIADQLVIPFEEWTRTRFERRQRAEFNEAARCADIVCSRLLDRKTLRKAA